MQSKFLSEFPVEQLKELKETKFIALLKEVCKAAVLNLTQSELGGDIAEEVDCEDVDEKKSGLKQGSNPSIDCLLLVNLDARLVIFGSFNQNFFKLNWCDLDYFFSRL